jgi:hypothetical protein
VNWYSSFSHLRKGIRVDDRHFECSCDICVQCMLSLSCAQLIVAPPLLYLPLSQTPASYSLLRDSDSEHNRNYSKLSGYS